MQVETFEIQEVAETTIEHQGECLKLSEELGLDNQKAFYNPTEGLESRVFPYRKLTAQEKIVYKTLCPVEKDIELYREGPIPLRILQVAAYAKEFAPHQIEGGTLVIWCPENADIKDPVLLWKEKTGNYDFAYWLLGRWGETLDNFKTLQNMARTMLVAEYKEKIDKIESEVKTFKDTIESKVDKILATGKEPSCWAHLG